MACLPALRSMTWDSGLMQGFERMDRELTDAEMLAGHLVPAGSMFAFLAAHRAEVLPDAGYADGRGAGAAGAARLFGPGDRRGGPVRCAVEGGLRAGGR